MENVYLQQVMQEKEAVERDLKVQRKRADPGRGAGGGGSVPFDSSSAVDVRITGFWRWRNVIVPPNAYVVHMRRGRSEPLDIGLGISFRFDPVRDSFLVVPSAVQTILVNANCICRERQGILVQGYVQWIIEDFATAYKKLDFSDVHDPMKVVNVQLREQTEAALKDTVATMGIDQVLDDKQPIIAELTTRLRQVAEGSAGDAGLGLRIVTVQIKEAVVSSARVWESLQKPFRAERSKLARIAELTHQAEVNERELSEERKAEMLQIEKREAVQEKEAEAAARAFDLEQNERARRAETEAKAAARQFDYEQREKARRAQLEAETLAAVAGHERAKIEAETGLKELQVQRRLAIEKHEHDARQSLEEQAIAQLAARRQVANDLSDARVAERMIETLPAIVENLPKPDKLHSVSFNGNDLKAVVGGLVEVIDSVRGRKADAGQP